MIQLKEFIPEIKIQPNNIRYPKIDDIYYLNSKNHLPGMPKGSYKVSREVNFIKEEWYFVNIKYKGNGAWVDKEQFEQWIKLGIIKYLHS